jgi:hypothetical protein
MRSHLYRQSSCGDRREAIDEHDEDRQRYLDVLTAVVARYNWICHAAPCFGRGLSLGRAGFSPAGR